LAINTRNNKPSGRHRSHFARYREIAAILMKYQLKEPIETLGLERYLPLRWLPPALPWQKSRLSKPERMRVALEEMGTTFVKLGQIVSTRSDLVPPQYINELVKLQNALKPLPAELIKQVIAKELGRPIEQIFAAFNDKAIGVASIGQVHAATLKDGTDVVVKVQKPGVQEQVEEDMEILNQQAASAGGTWQGARQYDLKGVIQETSETLQAEMDYVREGHSSEYFANVFSKDRRVHTPRIFWDYTTKKVLTMEHIHGIGILDTQALVNARYDLKDLAKRASDLWLKMIFEGVAFHADPHPGNLFVEDGGRLGLIDFGMIGLVDDEVRNYLIKTVKAILDRDVDLLIDSLDDLGALGRETSRDTLRADLRHIMSHYPKLTVVELQGNSNLGELLAVLRRNYVQLPSNTFLLLKTVAMAHSLGIRLDPDFDIVPLLEHHIRKVLAKTQSLAAVVTQMPTTIRDLATFGAGLPERVTRLIKSVERGDIEVRTNVSGIEIHLEHLERIINRIIIGMVVAAVLIGVALAFLAFQIRG
jgi:ubiquinone biosynthesis protein